MMSPTGSAIASPPSEPSCYEDRPAEDDDVDLGVPDPVHGPVGARERRLKSPKQDRFLPVSAGFRVVVLNGSRAHQCGGDSCPGVRRDVRGVATGLRPPPGALGSSGRRAAQPVAKLEPERFPHQVYGPPLGRGPAVTIERLHHCSLLGRRERCCGPEVDGEAS